MNMGGVVCCVKIPHKLEILTSSRGDGFLLKLPEFAFFLTSVVSER